MVRARFYGRMGNVLFQCACAIGYALKHNIEFTVPNTTNSQYWNPLYLQHLISPKWEHGREDVVLNEVKEFVFNEIEFNESWRDKQIVLNGYWQNEKYFKDYRSEILYLFDFPYEKKEGIVSVHVRRGDYLILRDKHPYYDKEWYENAMKQFEGYKFKFFSDDIAWCRETFGSREDCEFSTNSNEIDDLVEASCCEHHVNSSSTFSWWIAWLNRNPNKIIYTPKEWFMPGFGGLDTSDIIPPEWIKL